MAELSFFDKIRRNAAYYGGNFVSGAMADAIDLAVRPFRQQGAPSARQMTEQRALQREADWARRAREKPREIRMPNASSLVANPGALVQATQSFPRNAQMLAQWGAPKVAAYLDNNGPIDIARDAAGLAHQGLRWVARNPEEAAVAGAFFAPDTLAGLAEMRQMAQAPRAAGDQETADIYEQIALATALTGVAPLFAVGRGRRARPRPLAVKKGTANERR